MKQSNEPNARHDHIDTIIARRKIGGDDEDFRRKITTTARTTIIIKRNAGGDETTKIMTRANLEDRVEVTAKRMEGEVTAIIDVKQIASLLIAIAIAADRTAEIRTTVRMGDERDTTIQIGTESTTMIIMVGNTARAGLQAVTVMTDIVVLNLATTIEITVTIETACHLRHPVRLLLLLLTHRDQRHP